MLEKDYGGDVEFVYDHDNWKAKTFFRTGTNEAEEGEKTNQVSGQV